MQTRVPKAGRSLRKLRVELGLSLRDVQRLSSELGRKQRNPDYALSVGVLSEVENNGKVPHIYRFVALAHIYGQPLSELLAWYGVDVRAIPRASRRPKI